MSAGEPSAAVMTGITDGGSRDRADHPGSARAEQTRWILKLPVLPELPVYALMLGHRRRQHESQRDVLAEQRQGQWVDHGVEVDDAHVVGRLIGDGDLWVLSTEGLNGVSVGIAAGGIDPHQALAQITDLTDQLRPEPLRHWYAGADSSTGAQEPRQQRSIPDPDELDALRGELGDVASLVDGTTPAWVELWLPLADAFLAQSSARLRAGGELTGTDGDEWRALLETLDSWRAAELAAGAVASGTLSRRLYLTGVRSAWIVGQCHLSDHRRE